MATEDMKRLRNREDKKILGYLLIADTIYFQKTLDDIPSLLDMFNEQPELLSNIIFDHSLQQGDEVFFEGDEVELDCVDEGHTESGLLQNDGYSWNVGTHHVRPYRTLKLIKRAV